jgi:hypothetical protein
MSGETIVCGGCGRVEGHTLMCDLGGYTTVEQWAAEVEEERVHDQVHAWGTKRVEGCEICLADPPCFGLRISAEGREELREAASRYQRGVITLDAYDAERVAIITAHALDSDG